MTFEEFKKRLGEFEKVIDPKSRVFVYGFEECEKRPILGIFLDTDSIGRTCLVVHFDDSEDAVCG